MKRIAIVSLGILSFAWAAAHGMTVIIESEFWPSGTANWQGPITHDSGQGEKTPGFVRYDVDTGGNPMPTTDRIYADASSSAGKFAGNKNYSADFTVFIFDFYADGDPALSGVYDLPSGLMLYFVGNGHTWYYDILANIAGIHSGWNYGIVVPMNFAAGWTDMLGGTMSDFLLDIVDVDEIGWEITPLADVNNQVYFFDDPIWATQYYIPEPTTYAALACALLSLCVTFKGKLESSMASVRSLLGR